MSEETVTRSTLIELRQALAGPTLGGRRIIAVAITLLGFAACGGDSVTGPPTADGAGEASAARVSSADGVNTLSVTAATDSTITVSWTQVGDVKGMPAAYRVKYAVPSIDWPTASIGCSTVQGTEIGAALSCTVGALTPGTGYEFQLMSDRASNSGWRNGKYSNVAAGTTTTSIAGTAGAVDDLVVTGTTDSGLTVRWTQVDDGTGQPASYRVKYALPPIGWSSSSATVGCDPTITGTQIGAELSCTISGLPSATTYEVQLRAFRVVDGVWEGVTPSNVATGTTGTVADGGMWVSASRLRQLPTSGPAWENVLAAADASCGTVDLSDQEQTTNVCVMAKALVFARTGGTQYRADVASAIGQIASAPTYVGRALALGRELGAYVIAADLIGLNSYDPVLDERFRTALRTLRTTYTSGAAANLIDCHEKRPNNWGAHCGATRVAIAVYLGDDADLARAAQVFKGYLGDRSSYAGFVYGTDLSWQCDALRPVGINPVGCARSGLSLDGVLPDDQRRGGSFTTSPPDENYVWEAMQGLLAQAVLLERAGYESFEWEGRALLRAARWLHDVNDFPAQGDDTWQAPLLNHVYGTTFPEQSPTRPGKNVGWTDWTHP